MKLPEKGPDFNTVLAQNPGVFAQMAQSAEVQALMKKAEEEYWPWEDFKYKVQHLKFSSEDLWCYLRFFRHISMKWLPFSDSQGHSFGYYIFDKLHEELHLIDQTFGAGFLYERGDILPEAKERYMAGSIMEEAIASSQIEGAATTRRVAKEMLRRNLKPQDRSQHMILNNYNTILEIKETLNETMSLTLLHRFHRMITENTLDDPSAAGRFRNENEPIQVMDQNDGQVLHTPPPAREIHDAMQKLCDFANSEKNEVFIHPVIKAIILHFWLANIHPYVDGNGRTARALFYWYMLKQKYWLFEYLSISRIILKSRRQYNRAFLHSELDGADLTYFIVYHMRAILRSIRELQEYMNRKQQEYKQSLTQLKKASWMNYRQRALIQHALRHPDFLYTIESHKNSHGVTYQTARTDLLNLSKKGYLEQIKSGRTFQFVVPANLPKKMGLV